MRPRSSHARAGFGLGALTVLAAAGGGVTAASAQQAAPAPAPATVAAPIAASSTAAKPAKRAAKLRVTSRRLNVRTGRTARVGGRLLPAAAGRTVTLERRGARGWTTIDKARTTSSGRYALTFRTRAVDTAQVRVRFSGSGDVRAKSRRVGRLNVFRPALASWYGPGLYGGHLACGGRLNAGTIGVAHKSLPCGTKLVLRNGSHIVRATVIDRGPYVGAREFDLTAATKQKLGFGSTGTILVAH